MSKSRGLVVLAVLASSISFLSRSLDRTYEIEYGADYHDDGDDDDDHDDDDDDDDDIVMLQSVPSHPGWVSNGQIQAARPRCKSHVKKV